MNIIESKIKNFQVITTHAPGIILSQVTAGDLNRILDSLHSKDVKQFADALTRFYTHLEQRNAHGLLGPQLTTLIINAIYEEWLNRGYPSDYVEFRNALFSNIEIIRNTKEYYEDKDNENKLIILEVFYKLLNDHNTNVDAHPNLKNKIFIGRPFNENYAATVFPSEKVRTSLTGVIAGNSEAIGDMAITKLNNTAITGEDVKLFIQDGSIEHRLYGVKDLEFHPFVGTYIIEFANRPTANVFVGTIAAKWKDIKFSNELIGNELCESYNDFQLVNERLIAIDVLEDILLYKPVESKIIMKTDESRNLIITFIDTHNKNSLTIDTKNIRNNKILIKLDTDVLQAYALYTDTETFINEYGIFLSKGVSYVKLLAEVPRAIRITSGSKYSSVVISSEIRYIRHWQWVPDDEQINYLLKE